MKSSQAYDLSRFEPREERSTPRLRVVKNKAAAKPNSMFSTFCLVLVLVVLVVFTIYNQVVLTELGAQISTQNAELRALEGEAVQLKSQLDASNSLRTLEEFARTQLGMGKLEQSQIVYINLQEEDCIQITAKAGESSSVEKIYDAAKELLLQIRPN